MRADACACILSIYSVELREFAGQVASSLAGAGRTDRLNDEGGPNWVLPRRGFRRPAGPRGKGHGEEAGNPLRVTTRVPHAAGKVTRCLAQACCVILPLVGATYLEPGDLLPIAARKAHTHRFRAPTVPRTLARHGHHESHSLDRSRFGVRGTGRVRGLDSSVEQVGAVWRVIKICIPVGRLPRRFRRLADDRVFGLGGRVGTASELNRAQPRYNDHREDSQEQRSDPSGLLMHRDMLPAAGSRCRIMKHAGSPGLRPERHPGLRWIHCSE